jgi:hypothetical protein
VIEPRLVTVEMFIGDDRVVTRNAAEQYMLWRRVRLRVPGLRCFWCEESLTPGETVWRPQANQTSHLRLHELCVDRIPRT